jgi:transposase
VENVEKVKELILDNPRLSTRDIEELTGINRQSIHDILSIDLAYHNVCSVWVPYALTEANKASRVNLAKHILKQLREMGDHVYHDYAIEDETWIPFTPLGTKAENKVWIPKDAPRPQVPKPHLTNKKCLLLLCLTLDKKFSLQTISSGNTINAEVYINFLKETGHRWRNLKSHPTLLSDLFLQHDNARPHSARITQEFSTERHIHLIFQAPYSPDFNMCDRWIFRHLKKEMRHSAANFQSSTDVETAAKKILRDIPESRFRQELEELKLHLQRVIDCSGHYVLDK